MYQAPQIENIAAGLPHHANVVGHRALGDIKLIAVHCDGRDRLPGDHEIEIIRFEAQYHISKNWAAAGQTPEYGDGLMYHFVVTSDHIYATRDLSEATWHAHNANHQALAVMLLCGFHQAPTPGELANLAALLEYLTEHRPDIPAGKADVWGHGELTQFGNDTPCPGDALRAWVQQYRADGAEPDPFDTVNAVFGSPTISREVFAQALAGSPALDDATADQYYDAAVAAGINPAFAPGGIFHHESHYGTDVDSTVVKEGLKNIGALRPHNGEPSRAVAVSKSGFKVYANWFDSALDLFDHLKLYYAGKRPSEIFPVYAPAFDHNDPAAYTRAVLDDLAAWAEASEPAAVAA